MPLSYIFSSVWFWFLDTGINYALLLIIAFIIPRVGRFAMRVIRHRVETSIDATGGKNQLALAGVGLYIVQIIAYFILILTFLQLVGFSFAGVAIPATVASAAVGFGAQSIIADFLAGFFILTEKQFGVGDWVRFEGNGIKVEGTVIEITMRATTIRTIAQETVIIPNSTAKVCINNSNNWSRAVVVMPVPMLGSDNISEVILRSEDATRRALAQEDIAPEILGELDVHPAVDVQPPTVVGMPWLVTMRFLVQVTAGNQWMVERAIRTQIISEFWSEYGSATTTSGTFIDKLTVDDNPIAKPARTLLTSPRFDVPVDSLKESGDMQINVGAGSARRQAKETTLNDDPPAPISPDDEKDAAVASLAATSSTDPVASAKTTQFSAGNPEGTDTSLDAAPLEESAQTQQEPLQHRQDLSLTMPLEEDEEKDHSHLPGLFRTDSYHKPWQKILSLGGRIRMSSTLMLGILGILLILKGLTVQTGEDWGGSNGWLAPSNDQEVRTTEQAPPEDLTTVPETVMPEPTEFTEPSGTLTTPAPSDQTEFSEEPNSTPTDETSTNAPFPSGTTQAPTSEPQPTRTAEQTPPGTAGPIPGNQNASPALGTQ